jgi:hypothetical protein
LNEYFLKRRVKMNIDKRFFLSAVLALLLVSPTTFAGGPRGYDPELTKPELGTPFTGHGVLCGILDQGVYTETKKTGSLRGAVLLYRIITDSPVVSGWETLNMNYDQHLKSGKGESWGTLVLESDVYDGALEEDWSAYSKRFVWYISGTYIGTGELEGYKVDYTSTVGDIASVPADTCGDGPVFAVDDLNGHVYAP